MMHRQLGVIKRTTEDKYVVMLYKNMTRDEFTSKKEAVTFIERELANIVNDFEFLVCYKFVDEIDNKVSFILMDKLKQHKFEKFELTKYEYVQTHYFYFSKDQRRKIIDWKNPDFQQLTRHSLSSRRLTQYFWLGISFLTIVFSLVLLIMFGAMVNKHDFKPYYDFGKHANLTPTLLLSLLAVGFVAMVAVFGIYVFRALKFRSLVKTDSRYIEKYTHIDWRHYERIVAYTNWVALGLSALFGSLLIAFAICYSQSPIFEGYQQYDDVLMVNNFLFPVIVLFGLNVTGSAYYIYRFHVEIAILKKKLLTPEGAKMYDHWLKHNDILPHDMRKAFIHIDDHIVYPDTEYPKENEKSMNLPDHDIRTLQYVVKKYEKLIYKEKLGKKHVDTEKLQAAKNDYLEFVNKELTREIKKK